MFEGWRDPRAHLMQYNDYMNVLRIFYATKYKAFLTTHKGSAKKLVFISLTGFHSKFFTVFFFIKNDPKVILFINMNQ